MKSSSNLKIALASLSFLGCSFAILVTILKPLAKTSAPLTVAPTPVVGHEPLFSYRSIGQAPLHPRSPSKPTPPHEGYIVEIKTVFTQQDAEQQLTLLAQKGVKAYYSPFHHKGKVYFRIRTGGISSKSQAQSLADQLLQKYVITSHVVRF